MKRRATLINRNERTTRRKRGDGCVTASKGDRSSAKEKGEGREMGGESGDGKGGKGGMSRDFDFFSRGFRSSTEGIVSAADKRREREGRTFRTESKERPKASNPVS
jgi:hypothetical protein